VADRDELERLWDTVEKLRERVHQLSGRVRALEWKAEQARRERRYILSLPTRVAAIIVTAAAVYSAVHILLGHIR
jgi:argininosuccinate lyase